MRNCRGERFMPRYHELAELAPRDVVVRAILNELTETNSQAVFLDVSHLDPKKIERRFPTITRTCRELGLDVKKEPVPVTPAAHYAMGGLGRAGDYRTGSGADGAGVAESFVETLRTNTSLLRRRIKSPRLKIEVFSLGELTRTDVAVVYIEGVPNEKIVAEVRRRLERIKVDGILESGYIEELIEDNPFSLFRLLAILSG